MDSLVMKSGGWLLVALVAVMAMAASADFGFTVHLGIIAAAAFACLLLTLKRADYGALAEGLRLAPADQSRYDDEIVRWGVIATLFWGVAGFAGSSSTTKPADRFRPGGFLPPLRAIRPSA